MEALIGVAGVVLGVIVSEVIHFFRRRTERRERLFYDVFPKRLEAHKDILRTIAEAPIQSIFPKGQQAKTSVQICLQIAADIRSALVRNAIFVHDDVINAATDLSEHYLSVKEIDFGSHGIDNDPFVMFTKRHEFLEKELLKAIRRNSGKNLIEEGLKGLSMKDANSTGHSKDKQKESPHANKRTQKSHENGV